MVYSSYTDKGGREINEDSYGIKNHNGKQLFIVADGLGGYNYGEVASRTALEVIFEHFISDKEFNLYEAACEANNQIIAFQSSNYKDMKTTIAVAYITENETIFFNVGDTRIYAFLKGKLIHHSFDHSVSQMAVAVGEIPYSGIRSHPDRNKLTQALGVKSVIKPNINVFENNQYDAILLCSDGFWEYVYEDEMEKTLVESSNTDEWLLKMRDYIFDRAPSNNDNNTAIAIIRTEDKL